VRRRRASRLFASAVPALAALLAAACASTPTGQDAIGLLNVESIDVVYLESFPVQITLLVSGVLPDGCTVIHDVRQQRNGATAEVTIRTRRTTSGGCIQIAPRVTESVRLEGGFPPGAYVVKVNGVEKRFST
jgi:inhibitor of cysteine peptidase